MCRLWSEEDGYADLVIRPSFYFCQNVCSSAEKVSEKFGKQYNISVLLYPQLLGFALGADSVADLGLNLNAPLVDKLLTRVENGYQIGN